MITMLTAIHIIICFLMILIVLLQQGKGADMGATFGGSSQTVFGSEGPISLLGKMTKGIAVIFMLTSLALAYFSANVGIGTIMQDVETPITIPEQIIEPIAPAIPLPQSPSGSDAESVPAEFPR